MANSLSVILGAGFSYNAGLPLANGIKEFFTRNNIDRVLAFGSGEFKWADFANDAEQSNGRNMDHFAYAYLLNKLVERYIKEAGDFHNYELFFQFVLDNVANREFLEEILKVAELEFRKDHPDIDKNPFAENYLFAFKHSGSEDITSLINHLIADLLWVRKKGAEIGELYAAFVQFLGKFDQITFTTLNHDLLLEFLIKSVIKAEYSDGFTKNQNVLFSDEGTALSVFTGDFSQPFQILKLHGSIDLYKYKFYTEEKRSAVVMSTGEYLYYKTLNFTEKQTPHRRNPDSGEPVQTFHFSIMPQFITGTKKTELIDNDKMYSELYAAFEKNINSTQTFLIVGYSYGDNHINEKIKAAIKNRKIKEIININPGMKFPYLVEGAKVTNLSKIEELSIL